MFALTEYGKLILQLSSSLDFVCRNKEYFSTHDLMTLPSQLVNRIGELSQAELEMDTIRSLDNAEKAFTEAERFAWGIGEGTIPKNMISVMNEHAEKGIELKFLLPEKSLPANATPPELPKNVEIRGIPELPASVALTEKAGVVCFRQIGGRIDYAGFGGKDPVLLNWIKDLFFYYWDKAKRP
jgi:predicted transcriptional regulator